MSRYECNSGFLIYLDETGQYLPFLVNVREQEIVWKGVSDDILAKIQSSGITTAYGEKYPTGSQTAKIGKWDVEIDSTGYLTARAEFKFSDNSNQFARSNDKHMLTTTIGLPLPLVESTIITQTTLKARDENVRSAVCNVDFVMNSDATSTSKITLYIMQMYDRLVEYGSSSVYVTIQGKLA